MSAIVITINGELDKMPIKGHGSYRPYKTPVQAIVSLEHVKMICEPLACKDVPKGQLELHFSLGCCAKKKTMPLATAPDAMNNFSSVFYIDEDMATLDAMGCQVLKKMMCVNVIGDTGVDFDEPQKCLIPLSAIIYISNKPLIGIAIAPQYKKKNWIDCDDDSCYIHVESTNGTKLLRVETDETIMEKFAGLVCDFATGSGNISNCTVVCNREVFNPPTTTTTVAAADLPSWFADGCSEIRINSTAQALGEAGDTLSNFDYQILPNGDLEFNLPFAADCVMEFINWEIDCPEELISETKTVVDDDGKERILTTNLLPEHGQLTESIRLSVDTEELETIVEVPENKELFWVYRSGKMMNQLEGSTLLNYRIEGNRIIPAKKFKKGEQITIVAIN